MSSSLSELQPHATTAVNVERKLLERYDQGAIERLTPAIELAVAAHDGHVGLDDRPLVLHCADVALSPMLQDWEQQQLGLLHDAATPGYSNFTKEEFAEQARAAGCSERVIAAAQCFARPPKAWEYDDWVSFLMRDELTRIVKMADSDAAIENFPPASANQLAAWQRTRQRLAENAPEPPDVTARIEVAMQAHPLPDLRSMLRTENVFG